MIPLGVESASTLLITLSAGWARVRRIAMSFSTESSVYRSFDGLLFYSVEYSLLRCM